MWQTAAHQVCTILAVVFIPVCVAQPQGLAPVEQAAQSGLPLITEFTLLPGERIPFVHEYTATADGPHRMIAAWGTVIPIKMSVSAANVEPIVQQGNPVTVRFEAQRGTAYKVAVLGVGDLPVGSVGQIYGGPDRAAPAPTVPLHVAEVVRPVQITPPAAQIAATPSIGGPLVLPLEKATLSPWTLAAVAAGVSRESVMGALLADPGTRQPLEQAGLAVGLPPLQLISHGLDKMPVPGGGKVVVPPPPVPSAPIMPANVPTSPDGFDWKSGIRLSPLVAGPMYQRGNTLVPLARWTVLGMCDIAQDSLPALLQQGLIALHFGLPGGVPDTAVGLTLDLPEQAGTFLVTVHLTDSTGKSSAAWVRPSDTANPLVCKIQMGAKPNAGQSPWLALTPLAGERGGYATILSVPSGASAVYMEIGTWEGWRGGVTLTSGPGGAMGWPVALGPDDPRPPALFGGITIMRL